MGAEPIGAPHSYNRVVPCLNLAPWLDGRLYASWPQTRFWEVQPCSQVATNRSVNTTALLMRIPQSARVGVRIRDDSIPKTSIAGERIAR